MSDPIKVLRDAFRKAFRFGERHWNYADSEKPSHWEKADAVDAEYKAWADETCAAIASLSAPKPESAEAVGTISQSHPMMGSGFMHAFICKTRLPDGTKVYTAPPCPEASDRVCPNTLQACACGKLDPCSAQQASAPVGVEGAARKLLEAYDDSAHPFEAAAAAEELRNALAQQPAPVAPVGAPVDVVREYLDARACYEAATRPPNSHAPAPTLKHGDPVALRLREARVALDKAIALAQQPAPVAPVGVEGQCPVCGAPTDPDYGHVGDCLAQQPAAKPDAFAVFAGEGGRVFRLSGYDGDTEAQVLGHVLDRARREGFAGTAQERMAELGWWVEPMYRRPTQQPAAVDGPYRMVDDVVTVNGIALDEVVKLGARYAAQIEKRGPRAAQVFEALVMIGRHALAGQQQEND